MVVKTVPFSYNTNAVSQKQYNEHLELYKGYVNKTNEISSILETSADFKGANSTYSKYRELKKEQTYAMDGIILHEEYFKNMTSQKQSPGRKTIEIINKFYGNLENWKTDFKACATSARGWCLTSYNQRTNTVSSYLQDSHDCGPITMAYPLIVLDMYEHAYFLDYGTKKNIYIEKFLDSINWHLVESKAENVILKLNK